MPIARRQPATPTPRPIFVPLERPPDFDWLVDSGESVELGVDGVIGGVLVDVGMLCVVDMSVV